MTNKYLCIHGHFYQPPRENPWLNEVEWQDGAYPYHDWNERITAECYARNSASRILDGNGKIIDIVNNYSRISFNFGPTLLEWLQKKAPDTYAAILQADKESQKLFGGHGSALAQAFNHTILPLSNRRDMETQVLWGIRDFEMRFGRSPEGMWCGETAVNTDVLEVLADYGIKFTILSPYQAQSFRKKGEQTWHDASNLKIDSKRPYFCKLPSGKTITLFFYDAPVSQGIAFEHLLNSGEIFANRLTGNFSANSSPELMHIATDGETYGHHHRYGEMALSYAIYYIQTKKLANLTVYGQYLERFPPEYEVQIVENSSWSCVHGIERWRSDCGCKTGGDPGWNQQWRGPLRKTFDWIKTIIDPLYEREMLKFHPEPWQLRNLYIQVIADRSEANVTEFLKKNFKVPLGEFDQIRILKLLEMQYNGLLMYTSCGWFFDEVTDLGSLQDLLYATRAVQLASALDGGNYEQQYRKYLENITSNDPVYGTAAAIFDKILEPTMLDLVRVGAHYAISSLFTNYPSNTSIYCYQAQNLHHEVYEGGWQRLALGQVLLKSELTWERAEITYAVLHLGDHQLFAGVHRFQGEVAFEQMKTEISASFARNNVSEILYLLDKHFGDHNYTFWHLFRDEQRQILQAVLQQTLAGVDTLFRRLYDTNYPIMLALKETNMALPIELKNINDFVLNADLRKTFSAPEPDLHLLDKTIEAVRRYPVELDYKTLNYSADNSITRLIQQLVKLPENTELMSIIRNLLVRVKEIKLEPELWNARNMAFELHQKQYKAFEIRSRQGDLEAKIWCEKFNALYESLNLKA
jgi:alpha-amylase/alpha-mannosidase (GH57 family)